MKGLKCCGEIGRYFSLHYCLFLSASSFFRLESAAKGIATIPRPLNGHFDAPSDRFETGRDSLTLFESTRLNCAPFTATQTRSSPRNHSPLSRKGGDALLVHGLFLLLPIRSANALRQSYQSTLSTYNVLSEGERLETLKEYDFKLEN